MEERKHLLQHKKSSAKDNAKIKWIFFWTGILFLTVGMCSFVYAEEFGGFDIATGPGEFEGEWAGWDDEPSYDTPDSEVDKNYTDEVRNDVQESNRDSLDSTDGSGDYAGRGAVESWNEQRETANGQIGDFYVQSQENSNKNQNRNEYTEEHTQITETVPIRPPETPTPVPTPTPAPTATATPMPAFTEVPETEEKTVTEYNEEYHLPPTECQQKMRLSYWKEELHGGECVRIQPNAKIIKKIISVRLNGQEILYETEHGEIRIKGLSKEKNILEIAVMIPADLTWTGKQKNVILAYNIF